MRRLLNIFASWAAIVGLFFLRCPITILWTIAFIVIAALDGEFWIGSIAHIGKEGSKIISPAVANRYSSSCIAMVTLMIWICAAGNHSSPDFIFWQARVISGSSMFQSGTTGTFKLSQQTSTASDVSTFKIITHNIFDNAAIAKTRPIDMLAFRRFAHGMFGSHHHKEPTESLSNQSFEWWHSGTIILQGMQIA